MATETLTSGSYEPGDVVHTSYGAGVVVGKQDAGFLSVRLWRIPGKSIGSSAIAYLRPDNILGRLPAAPGMVTTLRTGIDSSTSTLPTNKDVLVHTFREDRQTFIVSYVKDENKNSDSVSPLASRRRSSAVITVGDEYMEVGISGLNVAPSAKFYPILEALMIRGEETAIAATHMLENQATRRLIDQAGKAIQHQVDHLAEQSGSAGTTLDQVHHAVDTAVPEAEKSMKQVLQLVKDEDFNVLLDTCKERLQQLVRADLTEATRQTLDKTGIRIDTTTMPSSFTESIEVSRKAALSAIEQLLEEADFDHNDVENAKAEISERFAHAFDTLSTAAKSDRSLNKAFESITEKTSEWQEATGRLLQTRSASLFLEGASRIHARAAALLQGSQMQWAGEIGSLLTKSFTEGDAAIARLKSIELGDAVKNKLVAAIEVRTESSGGLDGIIAGALATVTGNSSGADSQIRDLLNGLQKNASKATSNAHETLITVLSSRSQYRDVALIRIESVLCSLESHFGDTLSPEDIAAIARGDGGTAKIFEPIAHRAMKEIEHQLDEAESHVTDKTVLEVLQRVRKIVSGEMTLSSVMDEVVGILNDDKVVAVGETLVQQSELVLDALEGASGNQAVTDALKIAERAGITKDSVMREIERLDVKGLIDTAESAVSDERARRRLLSTATDTALDFLLRILPSMPVPPFEGVKDGLVYFISNLSMEGFKVRKEDIHIELAGMRATKRASSLTIQTDVSLLESNGDDVLEVAAVNGKVKATELLIIDVRNVSAVLDKAVWSFEQTYMPYLKGEGVADVILSGGSIRLKFELKKRQRTVSNNNGGESMIWEPVLCLRDRSCSISQVDLSLHGEGRLTWILNKLASIFKGPLRDYVVRTIISVLTSKSGWILERLNGVLSPYWELVMRTAKLDMRSLAEADENDVVEEIKLRENNFIELVWRERLPLGINLLMNDPSGKLKVVDFPRGSQARVVCEKRGFDPEFFKGSTVLAVNGTEYDELDEIFEALKDPGRPKTVLFELAELADVERVRLFVEGNKKPKEVVDVRAPDYASDLRNVKFQAAEELGIQFSSALDNHGLTVKGFIEGKDGIVLAAERTGLIKLGDLLVKVNDEIVLGTDQDGRSQAIQQLEASASTRPLTLSFTSPYLTCEVIEKPISAGSGIGDGGSEELILQEEHTDLNPKRIVIIGFNDISGKAESTGILIGDHLVFLNGMPVGAGCRWLGIEASPTVGDVYGILAQEASYPMGLTFARPIQKDLRWSAAHQTKLFSDDEAETICVTIDHREQLGCLLESTQNSDIVVVDFRAVPGVLQRALRKYSDEKGRIFLSIEALNGQVVPSYATKDMVKNAITRSWKNDGKVEMWLCDDDRRDWLHSLTSMNGAE